MKSFLFKFAKTLNKEEIKIKKDGKIQKGFQNFLIFSLSFNFFDESQYIHERITYVIK